MIFILRLYVDLELQSQLYISARGKVQNKAQGKIIIHYDDTGAEQFSWKLNLIRKYLQLFSLVSRGGKKRRNKTIQDSLHGSRRSPMELHH